MNSFGVSRYTLDASVVVKWFLRRDEPDHAAAIRFRQDYLNGRLEIRCPDLLGYEVANVLRYKTGIREAAVLDAVRSLYLLDILIPADQEIMDAAVRIALGHDLSVYDAVYLGFARRQGCRLVTADRKILQKLAGAADVLSLDQVFSILS